VVWKRLRVIPLIFVPQIFGRKTAWKTIVLEENRFADDLVEYQWRRECRKNKLDPFEQLLWRPSRGNMCLNNLFAVLNCLPQFKLFTPFKPNINRKLFLNSLAQLNSLNCFVSFYHS
jgi:hypothetical protein